MYVPRLFKNDQLGDLHALIQTHPLGILVTELNGRPEATHVPCVLDRDAGSWGTLRFHLAGTNPSAGALDNGQALVIFSGPDSYISPDWYRADNHVPTWNYTVVHAYGRPEVMDDDALADLLADLSAASEARLPKEPWTTDKLPPDLYAKMRRAIVGFRMPIDELQGKWKLGQNRKPEARAGVVESLRELEEPRAAAVAELMAAVAKGTGEVGPN